MGKNVQIPEALLLDLYFFFESYPEAGDISSEEGKRLVRIRGGLDKKISAYMARETYGEYKRSHKDDKGAKLKNYLDTKELYKLREARHGNL